LEHRICAFTVNPSEDREQLVDQEMGGLNDDKAQTDINISNELTSSTISKEQKFR